MNNIIKSGVDMIVQLRDVVLGGLLFIATPLVIATPIANLTFTDVNLETCVTNTATTNGWTDSSQVTSLVCSSMGISDAGGIEALTNLQTLQLQNNALTALDVTALSNLVTLYVHNNQLTSLTGLAGLTTLKNLYAYTNQLTSIDVTGNSAMVHLRVQDNQLTSMGSAAGMPSLSTLLAQNNQLISVDVTGASSLVTLYVHNNQLTSLTGLAGLTSLKNLYAYTNQLTSIDVTGDTGLVHLRVNANSLTNVNSMMNLTQLSTLFLAGNTDILCTQLDALEAALTSTSITRPNPCNTALDTDSDGVGDNIDPDIDGDGFSNDLEIQSGSDPFDANDTPPDLDGDGIPDSLDPDVNGNGVLDVDEGKTTTMTYNGLGLVETIDGPRIDVFDITAFEYDVQGNLTKTTNALGHETNITSHDAHGRPLTILDVNNVTSTLAYDARGRLLSRTVDGEVTTFEYDGVGNITKTTLANGAFLLNEYDAAQRLTAVEDNQGNRIEYTLDDLGNRTLEDVKDPLDVITRTQSRVYNSLNRLIESIGGENQSTTFGYDANGNQTTITVDPTGLNQQTVQAFDGLNRLSTSTDADSGITTFGYDARDNLTSVTDAEGLVTSYTYDAFSDLLQQQSPDTGISSFDYDHASNRIEQTDARGIISSFSYDALNRLTNISYPDITQNVSFIYDSCTNGVGRLCQMSDAAGSTTYAYDGRGNLTSQISTIDSIVATTSYAYNVADQLIQMTNPSGRVLDYSRNVLGQIDGVTTTQGTTDTVSSNVLYEPFGPMYNMMYGNNLIQSKTYDLDYRLTQILTMNGVTHQDLGYLYDTANNITDITNLVDNTRSQTLDYDTLNRLTDAISQYGDIDYVYDGIGNRLSETIDTVAEIYSYAIDSHQLDQTDNGSTRTYSYDANGNTTDNTDMQFSYGDNNRLKEASIGASTLATFTYNGRGERVKKDGNALTYFYYNQSGQLIAELDFAGNTIVEYVYLDGQPLALIENSSINFIHNDHLGTPQQISDGAQTIVWKADYNPFGEATVTTQIVTSNIRFPGQYFDEETGLHYNYFRYYDPNLGRYITSDPIGLSGGFNTYRYVSNNPVKFMDITGLVEGSAANIARRSAIDASARGFDGSTLYCFACKIGKFAVNSNKCNKFVNDVISGEGAPAEVAVPQPNGDPTRPPTAGEIANKNADIPNWRVLKPGEKVKPGDIAAYPTNLPVPGATGHTGVMTSDGKGGISNMSAHEFNASPAPGQFLTNPLTTFRRYTGE